MYCILYRVVQIKVYDRVCSLNELINIFFGIFFFSIYIQTLFFANMNLKLIEKELQKIYFMKSARLS